MKILNGSRRGPIPEHIVLLEDMLGCNLHGSFRAFLEVNNGGVPRKREFKNAMCHGKGIAGLFHANIKELFVQVFYPLTEEVECNIRSETLLLHPLLPHGFANIASIDCGDCLLLDASSGKLHVLKSGKVSRCVATDIKSFVNCLDGDEAPEESNVSRMVASGDVDWLKRYVQDGNTLNTPMVDGYTVIQLAAIEGDMAMVKACIALGARTDGISEVLEKFGCGSFLKRLSSEGLLKGYGTPRGLPLE